MQQFAPGDLVTFHKPHRASKPTTPKINGIPADQLGVFISSAGGWAEIDMSFSTGRKLKVELSELRKV